MPEGAAGCDLSRQYAACSRDDTSERLDEALELSNDIFTWMLDGAKEQCGLSSDEEGWAEVQRRLQTLCRRHEHKLYKPVTQ